MIVIAQYNAFMMRGRHNSADPVDAAKNQDPVIEFKPNKPMEKGRNGARYFRNPPQPHMCIQDFIEDTNEPCFINVLSWVKISTPRRPEDPIPLYGGMRVPHNSSAALSLSSHFGATGQPVIFAVMANPEILRLSGKTAPDPSDRDALVELMIDFVEAMNPDIRFKRRFTVLRDRDLAGELKDIWLAVQTKREREKGENGRRGESDRSRENREDSWREEARQRDSRNSDRVPDRGSPVPATMHDQENIDTTPQECIVSSQGRCDYGGEDVTSSMVERQINSAEEISSSLSPEASILTPSADPSCNKTVGAINYKDESIYSLNRSHYTEEYHNIMMDSDEPSVHQDSPTGIHYIPRGDPSKPVYPLYPGYPGESQNLSLIAQPVDDISSSQVVVHGNSSAFAKYKHPESYLGSNNIFSGTDSNIQESLVLASNPGVCEYNSQLKEKEHLSLEEEKSNLKNSNPGHGMASVNDDIFSGYTAGELLSNSKTHVPNVAGRSHEDLLPNLNDSQGVKFAISTDQNSAAIP